MVDCVRPGSLGLVEVMVPLPLMLDMVWVGVW